GKGMLEPVFGALLAERLVRVEERYLRAGVDPEQMEAMVDLLRVRERGRQVDAAKVRIVRDLHRGAEARDRGEQLGMAEPDRKRLAAAHRQPGDSAVLAIREHPEA